MLNHITIQGRLSKDPELRYTKNQTAVATFSVAVQRDYDRDKTDFIDVVAWRQAAEFIEKYFRKGQMIVVSGSLQMRDWEDKHGTRRTSAEVVAEHVYFCSDKATAKDPVDVGPDWEDYGNDGGGVLPF